MKFRTLLPMILLTITSNGKWDPKSSDTFATHQPVLYEIAMNTTGPIIEFGCGYGSTDLLHKICKAMGRTLISIDDNHEWLSKFSQKYLDDGYSPDNSGWHKFLYVPGNKDNSDPSHWIKFLDSCELLQNTHFDLCFIDQSPGLARTETIIRLKNKANYIILHDCDMYVGDNYKTFIPKTQAIGRQIKPLESKTFTPGVYDFSDTFKYFKVFFPPAPWPGHSGPPTLLGSNFKSNLPDVDYNSY